MSWQTIVFSIVALILGAGLTLLLTFLRQPANTNKWTTAAASLIEILRASIAHAESELTPELRKAYEDNTMTDAEWQPIKAKIIALSKQLAKDELKGVMKVIGIENSAIDTFLSGMIEQLIKVPESPVVVAALPKQ